MSLITRHRSGRWLAAAVLLLVAACEGANLFESGIGIDERSRPTVVIESPDSGQRVAIGDSVFIQVRTGDEQGVVSLELSGVALSGSTQLGTLRESTRFITKTVQFTDSLRLVRDTVITRYLVASTDSVSADSVFLIARSTDQQGNIGADTVRIGIGGPRIRIAAPASGASVRPGAQLSVRLAGADSANLIQEVTLVSTGSFTSSSTLRFEPALASIDTLVTLNVPGASPAGTAQLTAIARNSANDSTLSVPVTVTVLPPAADSQAPRVTFSTTASARSEQQDSIRVVVTADDDIRVQNVGATIVAIRRLPVGPDTLSIRTVTAAGDSAGFSLPLAALGVPVAQDSSTIRIETTAFALDSSGNCAAATSPNSLLSEACTQNGTLVLGPRSGARTEIFLVPGVTARPRVRTDQLADLAVDEEGRRVFVTNFSRNRLDVLPFGSRTFADSIKVGSEPWGVTMGVGGDTLFVANSGGTNISVVPLVDFVENQALRVRPPDVRLYGFEFEVLTDSVSTVTEFDYSDRPQFIGQLSSGELIYSTKPTSTREPGTIRIVDRRKDQTRDPGRGSEIFDGYATTNDEAGIVVNALAAGVSSGGGLTVCPRKRLVSGTDPSCVTGTVSGVRDSITVLRQSGLTDTRVDVGLDISSIPLTDTTFVAVSRDNSTVAFGEGAVNPGRVFLFQNVGGNLLGSSSETTDLLGNAAESVIGLGLNGDGTLGAARGNLAYFFDDDLRQEGQVAVSGRPTGGIAVHPGNRNYPLGDTSTRLAFVSAEDARGVPYIEVVNTFTFISIKRVYIRDRIVGTLAASIVQPADPEFGEVALRLYGITTSGVIEIELRPEDLQ